MRRNLDNHLADLGRVQGSVASTAQLRALGVTGATLTRDRQSGRLVPIWRGVHLIGGAVLTPRAKWTAALLAVGGRSGLSHITGAAARGLLEERDAPVHVTVEGTSGRAQRPGLVVHRVRRLDLELHRGLPTVPVARLVLQLCATESRRAADKALRTADATGQLDDVAVQQVLVEHHGRPGAPLMAALVALHERRAITLTESDLEDLVLDALGTAVALPRTQVDLLGHRADFVWPAHRYVLEADGWDAHRDRAAFQADRAQDRKLRDHGWVVDRVTHADVVHEPAEVAALVVRRLLAVEILPPGGTNSTPTAP